MSQDGRDSPGDTASEWQQRITGEWYGLPSVFDADGSHTGFNKVSRASVFADGQVTFWMKCNFMNTGPLRNRFEITDFEFGVDDQGNDRIYLGPDFYGAGHPYGSLVDSHYYSPGWRADLNTMNQILPRRGDPGVLVAAVRGADRVRGVQRGVPQRPRLRHQPRDQGLDRPPHRGRAGDGRLAPHRTRPHRGQWTGQCQVYGADQQPRGTVDVRLRHDPIDLVRARHTLELSGAVDRSFSYVRTRSNGNRYTYDGPDLWGNAIAYGRALYTSQHHVSEASKVKGREFIIDRDYTLAVAWKLHTGDRMTDIVFGPLTWSPD